jgi:hypothetical protein
MNKITVLPLIAMLLCWCWGESYAAPYPPAQDNEFFIYTGAGLSLEDTNYQNRFNPYGAFEWTGVQAIRFENKPQMGIGLGFTHWFSAHWGVQILGQYHKSKLSGHSDPVHITYTYYAWMPDQPFPEVNVDYTLTSPREPSGSFNQLSLGLNAAYRFQVPPVEFSLSGGLSYYRFSGGEINDFYFENSIMVSRGTIFTSSAFISAEMRGRSRIGANLGIRAQFQLAPSFHLFLESRFFYCPPTDMELQLTAAEEIWFFWHADDLADIEPLMEVRVLRLKPSFLSLCFGFSVTF